MDNIKILDGQWHVRNGKRWNMRSNFVFDILYEVAHPQDSIYVVEVTTDSGQKGEAFFKAGDLHNPKDFQTSLNRTFKVGTLLCHFKQVELLQLVAQMASEARRRAEAVTYRRRMVLNAGKQEGTSIIFLSPNQIMDISTGAMVITEQRKAKINPSHGLPIHVAEGRNCEPERTQDGSSA
ncbi:uncharacterized protein LOC130051494 [Ostrea edulis]|uniref:uncharacterized protein LOC130051494 n=1 Tax=Ostrea edulis TaxID=37623 RepID=UPI0024AF0914|nr:uncharacterized protein LOC130051494 [Ostrea edulis]